MVHAGHLHAVAAAVDVHGVVARAGHGAGRGAVARRVAHPAVRLVRPPVVVVRAAHQQQLRQVVEEDEPHPARHAVRARRAEVPVDDDDRDEDGEDVHDEREEEVLGDQRDADRRRRQDLGDEQEEDDERQQDADAHRHLLAGVRRQVEDGDAEERDEHARDDQVDSVEERLAADLQRERDLLLHVTVDAVRRVLLATRTVHDVPRAAVHVVAQVHFTTVLVKLQMNLPDNGCKSMYQCIYIIIIIIISSLMLI